MRLGGVTGRKQVLVRITISSYINLPWMICMLAFLRSKVLVIFDSMGLKAEELLVIPVIIIAALWPIVMVRLKTCTQDGQSRCSVCLWVKRISTKVPDLDSSVLAGLDNQHVGSGKAAATRSALHIHYFLAGIQVLFWLASLIKGRNWREKCGVCSSWCK